MLRVVQRESDVMAYVVMMAVRLAEMRRVLKPTGSLYLHCDPTASHYLRLVLDALFGAQNFRSEVIWKRMTAHSSARRYGPVHDTLLYYSKSDEFTWNAIRHEKDRTKSRHDVYTLSDGTVVKTEDLTGTGTRRGRSGVPWRGFDPNSLGRHWRTTVEKLDGLDRDGKIYWSNEPDTWPRLITGVSDIGAKLQDVWTDIDQINSGSKERLGYPTQKPIALLERILAASSNEGDLVLDPFAGCGTTIEAAERLGRRWVGIDLTHLAVSVLRRRLHDKFPKATFRVRGEPQDLASARALALSNRFEFQAWIVDKAGGIPTDVPKERGVAKAGPDGGIDGWLLFRDDPKAARSRRAVISVKSDKSPGPEMVREVAGTRQLTGADMAVLLLLEEPTTKMLSTAKSFGQFRSELFSPDKGFDRVQILSAADLFAGRTVQLPGWNSSHRSTPPAGTKEATLDLFAPPKKTRPPAPAEQAEIEFKSKRVSRR